MAKYKIELDRDNCIGCGTCAALCPENWELQEDGKTQYKKAEITDKELECNKQAADSCPVNVIHIIDEKGKKLV